MTASSVELPSRLLEETLGFCASSVEAAIVGQRTWQTMVAAWPSRAGDSFADRMNEISKYVASRTLTQDDLT